MPVAPFYMLVIQAFGMKKIEKNSPITLPNHCNFLASKVNTAFGKSCSMEQNPFEVFQT
jgi:hypothetical protein